MHTQNPGRSRPKGNPTGAQTSKLARRVCADLARAGWRLERVLTDNDGEFRSVDFRSTLDQLGAHHTPIRARPRKPTATSKPCTG